jgi:hypothetical protein
MEDLFGIIASPYRGELRVLENIVTVTLGITNSCIDEPEAKDEADEPEGATEETVETSH